ncbi:DUF7260 family protein [Halorarum halobium]|uniref:DUF7260 family protein n=1 Tax=Halorarum halobium TaxID=3075121 RepID=UPI003CCCF954
MVAPRDDPGRVLGAARGRARSDDGHLVFTPAEAGDPLGGRDAPDRNRRPGSRALEREAARLEDAGAVVDEITTWIAATDETPLSALDFDDLRARHETLAAHRERCAGLVRQRQAFLGSATSRGGEIGVSHRSLIPSVYRDFPVDHPLLATVARVDRTCAECQRAVRSHLVVRG